MDRGNLGLAFGIVSTCLNIGVLAGPYIVGYSRDLMGDYTVGFYLMSVFSVLQVLTSMILYVMRTKTSKLKS